MARLRNFSNVLAITGTAFESWNCQDPSAPKLPKLPPKYCNHSISWQIPFLTSSGRPQALSSLTCGARATLEFAVAAEVAARDTIAGT